MRVLAIILLMLPVAAAAEVEFGASQGRFPVFGPSAEREAHFAAQKQAAAEEATALRRAAEARRLQALETREAEAQAEIARAEAQAQRPDACRAVVPLGAEGAGHYADYLGASPEGRAADRRARRIVCFDGERFVTVPVFTPRPRQQTGLTLGIDKDGVRGRFTYRQPGFGFGIEVK